ncbi:MAG: tyrosine-protein phosphatase [Bacteroidales bacterium]
MFDFFFKKESRPAKLPFKTDIHSHLIPSIDDGSPDIDTSLTLIESLIEMGIEKSILTPHSTEAVFMNTPQSIAKPLDELKAAVANKGLGIELYASFEYRMDDYFLEQIKSKNIAAFPNGHILIENPFVQPYMGIDSIIFDLQCKGLKPILAHPERYAYYHIDKSSYEKLHSQGCLFQVNILSMAGYYGKECQQITNWMLSKGMLDFIATDTHHQAHIDAIRAFLSSKDYRKLQPKLEGIKNDTILI